MKKIFRYLKGHLQDDFQAGYYLSIALFLTICISINYYFDFEDSVIDSYSGQNIRIFYYFLFYGFAYYSATLIMVYFKRDYFLLRKRSFWIKSLFVLAVLALDGAFHYHETLVNNELNYQLHYWAKKVLKNLINIFTTLIPLVLFYMIVDKRQGSFYGLTVKGFDYRPYFVMLLIMVPLIIAATFIDNFSNFYPIYKPNTAFRYLDWPEWLPAIIYELAYGWNFLTIELVFRGFMILGLTALMGRNVVIPMVVTYCFLHFGKPAGEAISSIFGGYILGVIAYETRSIFGGVIIHVGVAWMMEFFAWMN
ncbi:caax amino terminal protease family [Fulvivirga imtechensis AK7]|uniref:Caax amino terminal protease family n=1 Tax=Fulvivirga imtechensis AK7 TaxID=1237149 RepID=L8JZA4_9BACT|nr:CPBP family intramembrane glutamic endopeptidase [Fulvivirga imtechensis]ELR73488.1 caax amino terminal protease family [Fulvivirga imtechensis AK7]